MEHFTISGISITLLDPATAQLVWPGGSVSMMISPDSLFSAPDMDQLIYNLGLAFRLSGMTTPASAEFVEFINSSVLPGRDGFELADQKLYVWRISTNSDGTYRLEFATSKAGPTVISVDSIGPDTLAAFPGEDDRRQGVLWNIASFLRKNGFKQPLTPAMCSAIKAATFWF